MRTGLDRDATAPPPGLPAAPAANAPEFHFSEVNVIPARSRREEALDGVDFSCSLVWEDARSGLPVKVELIAPVYLIYVLQVRFQAKIREVL